MDENIEKKINELINSEIDSNLDCYTRKSNYDTMKSFIEKYEEKIIKKEKIHSYLWVFIFNIYSSWLLVSFDWPNHQEAVFYIIKNNLYEKCDLQTLQKIMFVIIRKDRFLSWTLEDCIEKWIILKIFCRFKELINNSK